MKIPFDIKFRPQIESGEYKVMLDCGVEAEILDWDKPGEYPIVCMAKKEGAIPFRTDNNGIAYHYPEGSNYSDLFIVTPEPELTEFEHAFGLAIVDAPAPEEKDEWYPYIKEKAAELLELAKAEVLNDLPRWRIEQGEHELTAHGIICGGVASQENPRVYLNGHSIDLYSLEKLPGFKE